MKTDVTFIVFGATGHLARTKLLPALAKVVVNEGVERHALIGIGSTQRTDDEFQQLVSQSLTEAGIGGKCRESFLSGPIVYRSVGGSSPYKEIVAEVRRVENAAGLSGNRVIYLAIAPSHLDTTVEGIQKSGLNMSDGWSRLVVEKPFGTDLASAVASNTTIRQAFREDDVYRIDHYLAKETVRNLLVFRFSNSLFSETWNRQHIESIEITVAESSGVEGRAAYYDEAGAVRDMVQNHLVQIMTLVAMEPPVAMTAAAIRSEKVKVLQSTRPIQRADAVLGRYTKGVVEGEPVAGYLATEGVDPDSTTPTYAAIRLHIDNWRWQGVPFYLRTGKRMSHRLTEVVVRFRRPPVCLFHLPDDCEGHQNVLKLRLQPHEGFELLIDVKQPGEDSGISRIPLAVSYDQILEGAPTAYETLLADVIEGDQTLFVRADEVEASWNLFSPLLDRSDVHAYAAGTDGPHSASELISGGPGHWSALG